MPTKDQNCIVPGRVRRRLESLGLLLLSLALIAISGVGCARSARGNSNPASSAERETTLRQIATDYAQDGDLSRAQTRLDQLHLANPAQLLVTMAEQDMSQGQPPDAVGPLAQLANDLGTRSSKLVAYLAPTAQPTALPPTPTPVPPTPTVAPSSTPLPATLTPTPSPLPPTAELTATPQVPRVVSENTANMRSGPGKAYPVIGKLQSGQEMDIIARNESGDWWQVAWSGKGQAWVAGTVVRVLGPIDIVPVAENIPPPPPSPTPAPPPPPTAPPKPAVAYAVKSVRLRSVGESAQRCTGGDHNIFVQVVDPAGNPLDGVRVREIWTGQIHVTGNQGKGSGRVEYDLYRGGGGQVEIVDEAGNRISELSRGMSNTFPDFDLMKAAGYCSCKPHPDDASCQADLANQKYLFAWGHYAYEVVFQRTY